jgi:DNA repair photolyase
MVQEIQLRGRVIHDFPYPPERRKCPHRALVSLTPAGSCLHRCPMCYARAYPWSRDAPALYVNTAEKLAAELAEVEICPPLYLSQVTDPLQPLPEVRELTARVVEVAICFGVPFHIITKNGEGVLWLLRRVPGLSQYPRWWLTITIEAPPKKQRITSPQASPVEERLRAAEVCAKAGVFVAVRTDPAIWGLVREEDEVWLLDHARDAGAKHIISALGHFNRLSFTRLLAALHSAGCHKEAEEVRRFYGSGGNEGFFRAGTIRAHLPVREKFHRFMREEAERRGMTYASCLEMGREWDSPGIPHCEAAPQGRLAKKGPSGKFELLPDCYADCLRSCPNPSAPPCGRPELRYEYPLSFTTLLPQPHPLWT